MHKLLPKLPVFATTAKGAAVKELSQKRKRCRWFDKEQHRGKGAAAYYCSLAITDYTAA